jgi:hypothetical protein
MMSHVTVTLFMFADAAAAARRKMLGMHPRIQREEEPDMHRCYFLGCVIVGSKN